LQSLRSVEPERLGAPEYVVEPHRLREAVVAVAEAVQMAVDQSGQHAPPVEVDEPGVTPGQFPDAPVPARGDDLAILDCDRLDGGVLRIDGRDPAVVKDEVRPRAHLLFPIAVSVVRRGTRGD